MSFSSIANIPIEIYTHSIESPYTAQDWQSIIKSQQCPYTGRKCIKIRKSDPSITFGTCTVRYKSEPTVICPIRFLQRRQIFIDTIHLLTEHQRGNQIYVIPEVSIPGGSVDFFVVSVHKGVVVDYLALEIQTMDTTGSVWHSRQFVVQQLTEKAVPQSKGVVYTSFCKIGLGCRVQSRPVMVYSLGYHTNKGDNDHDRPYVFYSARRLFGKYC